MHYFSICFNQLEKIHKQNQRGLNFSEIDFTPKSAELAVTKGRASATLLPPQYLALLSVLFRKDILPQNFTKNGQHATTTSKNSGFLPFCSGFWPQKNMKKIIKKPLFPTIWQFPTILLRCFNHVRSFSVNTPEQPWKKDLIKTKKEQNMPSISWGWCVFEAYFWWFNRFNEPTNSPFAFCSVPKMEGFLNLLGRLGWENSLT